jgi:hypothetical protein
MLMFPMLLIFTCSMLQIFHVLLIANVHKHVAKSYMLHVANFHTPILLRINILHIANVQMLHDATCYYSQIQVTNVRILRFADVQTLHIEMFL